MSDVLNEITPLSEKDCFYIVERHKHEFTYPLHQHKDFELNFIEHGAGAQRVVGDRLEEMLANARMRNPQGRTCSPEQMIGLIVFLLSESSSYVDGQSIGCDGGATFGDIWAYKPEEPED